MHLAYIRIVSRLSVKNYKNWCKFDEVLTKTNLLSFLGTRCTELQVETFRIILFIDIHQESETDGVDYITLLAKV